MPKIMFPYSRVNFAGTRPLMLMETATIDIHVLMLCGFKPELLA
uniref:Uncharacterized protein n=1 Tax=Anguilla anguilla TaxID=7936 RepID=A0A0E9UFI2_ANGAN